MVTITKPSDAYLTHNIENKISAISSRLSGLFLLSKNNGDFKDKILVGILFKEFLVTIVETLRTTEGLSDTGTYWIPYVQI